MRHQSEIKNDGQAKVGGFMTAREMALRSHNLSKDGMSARDHQGATWKWSDHFNVWACVATA